MEFHILGANERLCRETESKRLADERVDLAEFTLNAKSKQELL